jgi:riboflavin kinase / FMN adenylyltransferase
MAFTPRTHASAVKPIAQSRTPQLRVEVHLLDFTGQIYGEEMEVTFADRLRAEMKFPSLAELQAQIGRDVAAARELMGPTPRAV